MIFSELYSAYYTAVSKIIGEVLSGTDPNIRSIVKKYAFGESLGAISSALSSGRWQLLYGKRSTPVENAPRMPLTNLQKRWLKTISLDPKMALFGETLSDITDAQPLFDPKDIHISDAPHDPDIYSEEYKEKFGNLRYAIKLGYSVHIKHAQNGSSSELDMIPKRLVFDSALDVFYVSGISLGVSVTLRLRDILSLEVDGSSEPPPLPFGEEPVSSDTNQLTLMLKDERNALERCAIHFSPYKRRTERLGENKYILKINYSPAERTSIIDRIISFGPVIEVLSPADIREGIVERLSEQLKKFNITT